MSAQDGQLRWQIHPNAIFRLGEELITDHVQALIELVKNSYDADSDFALVEIVTNGRVGDRFPDSFFPDDIGYILIEDEGDGMGREQIQSGWLTVANSSKGTPGSKQRTRGGRIPMGDKGLGRLGAQLLGDHVQIWTNPFDETEQHHFGIDWASFRTATEWRDVRVFNQSGSRGTSVPKGTKILISCAPPPKSEPAQIETAQSETAQSETAQSETAQSETAQSETAQSETAQREQARPTPGKLGWISKSRDKLSLRLSELISPFAEIDGFEVDVTIDGEDFDIFDFRSLQPLADKMFSFRLAEGAWGNGNEDGCWKSSPFDENELRLFLSGKVSVESLRPTGRRGEVFTEELVRDKGERLLRSLVYRSHKWNSAWEIAGDASSRWSLDFKTSQSFETLDVSGELFEYEIHPQNPAKNGNAEFASPIPARISPGPFFGKLFGFSRKIREAELEEAGFPSSDPTDEKLKRLKRYKSVLDDLWGVHVYRDGFGVRTPRDFLDLGKQSTSGKSGYGLRPASTVGFISLSALENSQLEEVSNREGFRRTSGFRNFQLTLETVTAWTGLILEFLRRSTLEFLDEVSAERAGLDPDLTIDELSKTVLSSLKTGPAVRRSIEIAQEEAESKILRAAASFRGPKANELTQAVDGLVAKIREVHVSFTEPLRHFAQLAERFEVFERRQDAIQHQMREAADSFGLALVAEVVAHDLDETTRRFNEEFRIAKANLNARSEPDPFFEAWTRRLRSLNRALQKQVSHLNPALRYRRIRRESVDLQRFFKELVDYCQMRWATHRLRMQFDNDGANPAQVSISRGRLLMIFDNLVINNSEHWLKKALQLGEVDEGVVFVRLDFPVVEVWDNGLGIDPAIEDRLFEPYVTTKAGGRGIGLYIVRQLLEDEGCNVTLLRRRNRHGRRFVFQLVLSGIAAN